MTKTYIAIANETTLEDIPLKTTKRVSKKFEALQQLNDRVRVFVCRLFRLFRMHRLEKEKSEYEMPVEFYMSNLSSYSFK